MVKVSAVRSVPDCTVRFYSALSSQYNYNKVISPIKQLCEGIILIWVSRSGWWGGGCAEGVYLPLGRVNKTSE